MFSKMGSANHVYKDPYLLGAFQSFLSWEPLCSPKSNPTTQDILFSPIESIYLRIRG